MTQIRELGGWKFAVLHISDDTPIEEQIFMRNAERVSGMVCTHTVVDQGGNFDSIRYELDEDYTDNDSTYNLLEAIDDYAGGTEMEEIRDHYPGYPQALLFMRSLVHHDSQLIVPKGNMFEPTMTYNVMAYGNSLGLCDLEDDSIDIVEQVLKNGTKVLHIFAQSLNG
jgi:hypothetical protein